MKRSLAVLLLALSAAAADVPRQIQHEGRILRADGTPERSPMQVTFTLHATATGGSASWSEVKLITPSASGYYAVVLGETTALPALDNPPYWLAVTIAGETEMAPRTRLGSVPFALRAAQSDLAARALQSDTSLQKRGALFTRWGRSVCPTGTSVVYTGYAASSRYTHGGAGANTLCMASVPTWDAYNDGNQNGALLYGMEFETGGQAVPGFPNVHDYDGVCAVCLAPAADLGFMYPGSQVCPSGWTTQYAGYIMATHYTQTKSEFVCVDRQPEAAFTAGSTDGALWYFTEMECDSPMRCPPYVHDREVTCSICTR